MKLNEWLCENVMGWKRDILKDELYFGEPVRGWRDGNDTLYFVTDLANDPAACMELFEALCRKGRKDGTLIFRGGVWNCYLGLLPTNLSSCKADRNAAILSVARQYAVMKGWKEDDHA